METFVQTHEAAIRLTAFLGIFAGMALWEWRAPRRALTVSKTLRWASNLGLVVLNTVLLRLLFPVAAVAGTWNLRATSVTPSATITFTHEVAADAGDDPSGQAGTPDGSDPGSDVATTQPSGNGDDAGDDGGPVISPAPEPTDEGSSPLPWILGGVAVVLCVGLGVVFVRRGRDQGPID